MKTAVFLLVALAATVFGASDAPALDWDEPISPMLLWAVFMFAIAAVCIVAVAILAGIIALLIAVGMVSSATVVGLYRRRLSDGLRAFHYQFCAVLAMPGGIGAVWCWRHFFRSDLGLRKVFLIGSVSGTLGGLLFAFLIDRAACAAYRRCFAALPPK
jgi:hypothetical protein